MTHWHSAFPDDDSHSSWNDRVLVLAGPSGCGKTTIATALVDRSSRFHILCNYTTRAPRETDHPGQFKYYSEQEFHTLFAQDHFVICRTGEQPLYGYSVQEFSRTISSNKTAVFMFRSSGLEFLAETLDSFTLVSISGEPNKIAENSQSIESVQTPEKVLNSLKRNRKITEQLADKTHRILHVKNSFSGADEILRVVSEIQNQFTEHHE